MRVLVCLILVMTLGCASMPQPSFTFGDVGYAAGASADIYTTVKAIDRGAVEVNPAAVWLCGSNRPELGCLIAIKSAGYAALKGMEIVAVKLIGRQLIWWERFLMVWAVPIAAQFAVSWHNNGVAR